MTTNQQRTKLNKMDADSPAATSAFCGRSAPTRFEVVVAAGLSTHDSSNVGIIPRMVAEPAVSTRIELEARGHSVLRTCFPKEEGDDPRPQSTEHDLE